MADPSTISGLIARFRADSITGLADGAAIANWPDTSGNGAQGLNPAGNTAPIWKSAMIGGQPAVRFLGRSKELLVSSLQTSTGPQTIVAVLTSTSTTATQVIRGGTQNSATLGFRLSAGKLNLLSQAVADYGSSTTSYALTPLVAIAAYTPSSGVGAFRLNGATAGTFTKTGSVAASNTLVGQQFSSDNERFTGDLAELLIWHRILTDAEQAAVDTYVQDRYGISVSDYVPSSAAVALTGNGTATATGTPRSAGSPALVGTGNPSATGAPQAAAAAALSGTGTASAGGSPQARATAALSGAGTVTAAGMPAMQALPAMFGAGTIAAVGGAATTAAPQLSGIGQVTGGARASFGGTATLAGLGMTTVDTRLSANGAVALTGESVTSVVGRISGAGAAQLTGSSTSTARGRGVQAGVRVGASKALSAYLGANRVRRIYRGALRLFP